MYSMIASRTRHLVSPASSKMAGSKDCDNWFTPITVEKNNKKQWNGYAVVNLSNYVSNKPLNPTKSA